MLLHDFILKDKLSLKLPMGPIEELDEHFREFNLQLFKLFNVKDEHFAVHEGAESEAADQGLLAFLLH